MAGSSSARGWARDRGRMGTRRLGEPFEFAFTICRDSRRRASPDTRDSSRWGTSGGRPSRSSGPRALLRGTRDGCPGAADPAVSARARCDERSSSPPPSEVWTRRARRGIVVVVTDHLNMMGTAPLARMAVPGRDARVRRRWGSLRPELAELALERARALDIAAAPGVYAAMSGPAYETPAEIGLIGQDGATVVGMSMVPEVVPARALDMRVLGLAW